MGQGNVFFGTPDIPDGRKLTVSAPGEIGAKDVESQSSVWLIEGENGGVEDGVKAGTANHFRHHVLQHAVKDKLKYRVRRGD